MSLRVQTLEEEEKRLAEIARREAVPERVERIEKMLRLICFHLGIDVDAAR